MSANSEAPPSPTRRLAIAQRPGPNGSRVSLIKKPSLPRLGDLASITSKLRGLVDPLAPQDDETSNLAGSSSESTSSKASHDQHYVTPDSSPPTPCKPSRAGNMPRLLPLLPQLPQPISSFGARETRRYQTNEITSARPAWESSFLEDAQCQMNADHASFHALAADVRGSDKHVAPDVANRLVSQSITTHQILSPSRPAVYAVPDPIDESLRTPAAFLAFWKARCKLFPSGSRNLPDQPTRLLYDIAEVCTREEVRPQWRDEEWQKAVARYLQQTGGKAHVGADDTVTTTTRVAIGAPPVSAIDDGVTRTRIAISPKPKDDGATMTRIAITPKAKEDAIDEGATMTRIVIPPKTKEDEARKKMQLVTARSGKWNAYHDGIAFNSQPSPSASGVARSIRLEHSMALAITKELHDLYPQQPISGPTVIVKEPSRADKLHRKLQLKGLLGDTAERRHVHIFVDMSNIFIGFEEHYRTKNNIPKSTYMHLQPAFFLFRQLAHILERDRNVVKRKLAGSVANAHEQERPPAHFVEAESAGYDTAKMLRVAKHDHSTPRFGRKPQRYVSGPAQSTFDWTTTSEDESGDGSGSSPVLCPRIKLGEQGVDENLHLAMQSSLVDYDYPGTMVLATGDAKEAEFSEGFAHYAIKAMDRGWNVEVVSWKKCLSSVWRRAPFANKYSKQFRIVELDNFYEDLLADWLEPSY